MWLRGWNNYSPTSTSSLKSLIKKYWNSSTIDQTRRKALLISKLQWTFTAKQIDPLVQSRIEKPQRQIESKLQSKWWVITQPKHILWKLKTMSNIHSKKTPILKILQIVLCTEVHVLRIGAYSCVIWVNYDFYEFTFKLETSKNTILKYIENEQRLPKIWEYNKSSEIAEKNPSRML